MGLLDELKRRKVFKVGGAYLVVAWLVVQGASIGFPAFDAPPWALRIFILVAFLGFPVALVFAWVFDATAEGLRTEPVRGGGGLYVLAGALAALALGWYFVGQPSYRAGDVPAVAGSLSVAVLPFANMSGNPDEEYFSDGMTEELLNVLARIPKLDVVARTSVFEFKGKGGDVREIGRKLGVSHIVEGSIRRDAGQVRVTAQLVRVADGFHLWSENYDRELKGVFALQDDIARQIGEQLQLKLGVGSMPESRVAIDPAAYDEYLKGRALLRSRSDIPGAIAHFQAAVARAPDFGAAWSSLSLAQEVSFWSMPETPKERDVAIEAGAAEAAARAAAIEPDAATTEHALGNVARLRFRYAEAERHYLRAMALDPGYPDVREDHAELLLSVGSIEASARAARQLVTLDPYFTVGWVRVFNAALALDRRTEVEEAERHMPSIKGFSYYGSDEMSLDYALAYHRIDDIHAALRRVEQRDPALASARRTLVAWALKEPGVDERAVRAITDPMVAPAWRLSGYYALRRDLAGYNAQYERASALVQARYFVGLYSSAADGRALLGDPAVKPYLVKYGFVAYWREKGWPDICRPLGADDFECGETAAKG